MDGKVIGFCIWTLFGLIFMGLGIYAFWSKKPVGFWANAKTAPVKDIKAYNRCMGRLYCGFGIVFIALGLPMLGGQNSPMILLSCIGVMFEVIIVMVIYMRIENKYREK